jgi:membrane-associated phospholipid phosphatase
VGSRGLSALLVAGASVLGLFWTWLVAFHTDAGARADQRIVLELAERRPPEVARFAVDVARLADPGPYLILVALVLAVPLVQRRWLVAAAVAVLIAAANLTTQLLQELTYGDRHVLLMPRAYWPSGHTTAIASVGLGLLLVVPRRLRVPAAGLAVIATAVIGWAMIVLGAHLPSDVVAAVFVCGTWASLVVRGLLLTGSPCKR